MTASLLTLYGGLIFSQEEKHLSELTVIFFILIIIVNARFLILWIFCVTTVYKKRRQAELLSSWIKRAFCIKVDEVNLTRIQFNYQYSKMRNIYDTDQKSQRLVIHIKYHSQTSKKYRRVKIQWRLQ